MKYRWLHISDLHSICKGIKTRIMRDNLVDEVKYISQQTPLSFILVTGDISDKNNGYDEAKSFIYRLLDVTGININNVFIIPGNHDLDRGVPKDREFEVKKCWNIDVLDDQEVTFIKKLLPGQNDFFKAYEDILGRKYPVDQVHFVHDFDENISIIHLNTSWVCYDSENESGKLHIGLNSVIQCLSDEKLSEKPIKIAIGHHRINDFNRTVENHLKSLFKLKDVDLYLGGHCHDSSVIYDPSIDTEFCSCRQARAEDADYPAGFIIGDINTDNDQSSFQFYSWNSGLATWTYDYTVSPAKHGKYYLRGGKFTKEPIINRNIIVDLKLFGLPLNYDMLMNQFGIENSAIYRSSVRNIRPENQDEWNICLKEIQNIYNEIIVGNNKHVHVFPLALIPLLVSFGYLIQNDSSNISIYQYYENEGKWVFDEKDDRIQVFSKLENKSSRKLALALSISDEVMKNDIEDVLDQDFDLLSVSIEDPSLSKLNYNNDVFTVKTAVKNELDKLSSKYDEIHMFLAAPAGVCIEIGRIIRENMYPDTFVYNFKRDNSPRYSKVFNLKDIKKV